MSTFPDIQNDRPAAQQLSAGVGRRLPPTALSRENTKVTRGTSKPASLREHRTYCGRPLPTTLTRKVTVPSFFPSFSAFQMRFCHVSLCEADGVIVS